MTSHGSLLQEYNYACKLAQETRNNVLEEAAKIVEAYDRHDLAEEIRKRKEP